MPEAALQVAESSADAGEENTGNAVSLTALTTNVKSGASTFGWWLSQFVLDVPHNAFVVKVTSEIWITSASEIAIEPIYEEADNSAALKAEAKNISARALGKAATSWSLTPTAKAFNAGPDYTPAVQALVRRAGWVRGNRIALGLRGTTTKVCTVENFDGTAAHAMKLNVLWLPKPPLLVPRAVQRASTW